MQPDLTTTPLVCAPGAIPVADRPPDTARSFSDSKASVQGRMEIPDGYAFRFGPEAPWVARFIDNERKCCPFLTFQLTVSPAEGPVWLRMDGPHGTRDLLDAEMLS